MRQPIKGERTEAGDCVGGEESNKDRKRQKERRGGFPPSTPLSLNSDPTSTPNKTERQPRYDPVRSEPNFTQPHCTKYFAFSHGGIGRSRDVAPARTLLLLLLHDLI